MSIIDKALNQALTLLNAAKVQYAVVLPDGTIAGELQVKVVKKRGGFVKKNDFVAQYNYIETLRELPVGGTHKWEVRDDQLIPFQSAVCGTAGRLFGTGNFMTTVDREARTVEILRVQ